MNLKLITSAFAGTLSIGVGVTAYVLIKPQNNDANTLKSKFPNLRVLKEVSGNDDLGIWTPKIHLLKDKLKDWKDEPSKEKFFKSMIKNGISETIVETLFKISVENIQISLYEAKALSVYCNNVWVSKDKEDKDIEDVIKSLCVA